MRTFLTAVMIATAAVPASPAGAEEICVRVVVVTSSGPQPAGGCHSYADGVICIADHERVTNPPVAIYLTVCVPAP